MMGNKIPFSNRPFEEKSPQKVSCKHGKVCCVHQVRLLPCGRHLGFLFQKTLDPEGLIRSQPMSQEVSKWSG